MGAPRNPAYGAPEDRPPNPWCAEPGTDNVRLKKHGRRAFAAIRRPKESFTCRSAFQAESGSGNKALHFGEGWFIRMAHFFELEVLSSALVISTL
jgi:hypothetical protein